MSVQMLAVNYLESVISTVRKGRGLQKSQRNTVADLAQKQLKALQLNLQSFFLYASKSKTLNDKLVVDLREAKVTVRERADEIRRLNQEVIAPLQHQYAQRGITITEREETIAQRDATIGVAPIGMEVGSGLRKDVADLTARVAILEQEVGAAPTDVDDGRGHLRTIHEQTARIAQLEAQVRKQKVELTVLGTAYRYTVGLVSTVLSLRFVPVWLARNVANTASLFSVR